MLYYVSGLKSSKALAAEFRLRLTLNVHRIVVPKWIWVYHWQQHCCTTPEFQVMCPTCIGLLKCQLIKHANFIYTYSGSVNKISF